MAPAMNVTTTALVSRIPAHAAATPRNTARRPYPGRRSSQRPAATVPASNDTPRDSDRIDRSQMAMGRTRENATTAPKADQRRTTVGITAEACAARAAQQMAASTIWKTT